MTQGGGGSEGGFGLERGEGIGRWEGKGRKKEGRKTEAGTVLRVFSVVLGLLPGQP